MRISESYPPELRAEALCVLEEENLSVTRESLSAARDIDRAKLLYVEEKGWLDAASSMMDAGISPGESYGGHLRRAEIYRIYVKERTAELHADL